MPSEDWWSRMRLSQYCPPVSHHTRVTFLQCHSVDVTVLLKNLLWLLILHKIKMNIFSQELNLYGPTPPATLAFLIPQPSLHVIYSVAKAMTHFLHLCLSDPALWILPIPLFFLPLKTSSKPVCVL